MDKTTIIILSCLVTGSLILLNSDIALGFGNGIMDISDDGFNYIKDHENFSPVAYKDGADSLGRQSYSIGYGHQIVDADKELLNSTITKDQAIVLLKNDLRPAIDSLNKSGINFTQGQFDALVDFGINEGIGALKKIILLFIVSGADSVPASLSKYIYWHPVPGGPAVANQNLVNRRNDEIITFNS